MVKKQTQLIMVDVLNTVQISTKSWLMVHVVPQDAEKTRNSTNSIQFVQLAGLISMVVPILTTLLRLAVILARTAHHITFSAINWRVSIILLHVLKLRQDSPHSAMTPPMLLHSVLIIRTILLQTAPMKPLTRHFVFSIQITIWCTSRWTPLVPPAVQFHSLTRVLQIIIKMIAMVFLPSPLTTISTSQPFQPT